MKILAFAASNSKNSINKKLVSYAAGLVQQATVTLLDLNDYEMPIYSIDKEAETGIPLLAKKFYNEIGNADVVMISFAEYNGTYTAAFKNIFDWVSRVDNNIFQHKPMLLLATSPGPRGGLTVLDMAKSRFPYHAANIIGSFVLPSFNKNFDNEKGIIDKSLKMQLQHILNQI